MNILPTVLQSSPLSGSCPVFNYINILLLNRQKTSASKLAIGLFSVFTKLAFFEQIRLYKISYIVECDKKRNKGAIYIYIYILRLIFYTVASHPDKLAFAEFDFNESTWPTRPNPIV